MEINWNLTTRQLRTFGFTSLVALPLAAGLWSHGSATAIAVAAVCGAVLASIAAVRPQVLRPMVVALNIATWPIVIAVNEIVLLAGFFGVIVPVGLLFRLFGRDALQLKINRSAAQLLAGQKQPAGARSYFRRW